MTDPLPPIIPPAAHPVLDAAGRLMLPFRRFLEQTRATAVKALATGAAAAAHAASFDKTTPPGMNQGAYGKLKFTANQDADGADEDGSVRLTTGHVNVPQVGRITLTQKVLETPLKTGGLFGVFWIILGETDASTRFAGWNSPHDGPIFTAGYDWDADQWTAYDADGTQTDFDPADTDCIVGRLLRKTGSGIDRLHSLLTHSKGLAPDYLATLEAPHGPGLIVEAAAAVVRDGVVRQRLHVASAESRKDADLHVRYRPAAGSWPGAELALDFAAGAFQLDDGATDSEAAWTYARSPLGGHKPDGYFGLFDAGEDQDVAVQWRESDDVGLVSDWLLVPDIAMPGDTTAPGPVTGATVVLKRGVPRVKWTNPTDADFRRTHWRRGTTGVFADATPIQTPGGAEHFDDPAAPVGASVWYFGTTADHSGNEELGAYVTVGPVTPTQIEGPDIEAGAIDFDTHVSGGSKPARNAGKIIVGAETINSLPSTYRALAGTDGLERKEKKQASSIGVASTEAYGKLFTFVPGPATSDGRVSQEFRSDDGSIWKRSGQPADGAWNGWYLVRDSANTASLNDVNSTEGTKLAGIADGATVGAVAGTNLKDSANNVLGDDDVDNSKAVDRAGYNRRPTFQKWTGSPASAPDYYSIAGGAIVGRNSANAVYGRYALDMTDSVGTSSWIVTSSPSELRAQEKTPAYVTFEWAVELISGDFRRSGWLYRPSFTDGSNVSAALLNLYDEHPSPTTGVIYRGVRTAPVTVTGAPSGNPQLFHMINYAGLSGGSFSAKAIRFHYVRVRPASREEIKAARAINDSGQVDYGTGLANIPSRLAGDTNGLLKTDNINGQVTRTAASTQAAANVLVYATGASGVEKADVNSLGQNVKVLGVTAAAMTSGQSVQVQVTGKLTLTGVTLSGGSPVYWDGSSLTQTIPTGTAWVREVGFALNSMDLWVSLSPDIMGANYAVSPMYGGVNFHPKTILASRYTPNYPLSPFRQRALDDLIWKLDEAGILGRCDLVYVMAGNDSVTTRTNLIAPGSFTLPGAGGATFTRDMGWQNANMDTGAKGSDFTQFAQNDASISVFSLGDISSNLTLLGTLGTGPICEICPKDASGHFGGRLNQTGGSSDFGAVASSIGLFGINRASNISIDGWVNGVNVGNSTFGGLSVGVPTSNLAVGQAGLNRPIGFAHVGRGLTNGQWAKLYTLVRAYLLSLPDMTVSI